MESVPGGSLRVESARVPTGRVVAVEINGEDFVAWRGFDGVVRTGPRWCPHLDHDLADGYVDGDELVCAGHAWAFDGAGHTFKRNEFGRVDPKGEVPVLGTSEDDAMITFTSP
jgi:phenylpropionate dioxygenase-like ring-hydroxylating dioxygenase large terminal subunit